MILSVLESRDDRPIYSYPNTHLPDNRHYRESARSGRSKTTCAYDFNALALMTEGYSRSDLFDIVQAVHMSVVREFFNTQRLEASADSLRPITMHDFLDVLTTRQPSVSAEGIRWYEHWYQHYTAL